MSEDTNGNTDLFAELASVAARRRAADTRWRELITETFKSGLTSRRIAEAAGCSHTLVIKIAKERIAHEHEMAG